MSEDAVIRLVITAPSACQSQVSTWDKVANDLGNRQVQVIFASTKSFVETAPQLRDSLEKHLDIPRYLFNRMYLQSNGFAGHDVQFDRDGKVEGYTHWSRFIVKQTYDVLLPKRTFTPHLSNYQSKHNSPTNIVPVHGPQSMQFGWEWYEMGFFMSWKSSGPSTLICFDLPTQSQSSIQTALESRTVDTTNPHSLFLFVADELLHLYDDSVWSIRNHISQWEARRAMETDYLVLHEIARHGVHVNETLRVAMTSLDAVQQHHEELRATMTLDKAWDEVGSRLTFQHQFIGNLLQRSTANNARIQNEITLSFNAAAQRDSKIQVRIGEEAKREASAMKAIAIVTMTFLPATFVSTIFGTNFFSFEPREGGGGTSFAVSGYFWIYWAVSIPLTVATLALWLWWSRSGGRLSAAVRRSTALSAA